MISKVASQGTDHCTGAYHGMPGTDHWTGAYHGMPGESARVAPWTLSWHGAVIWVLCNVVNKSLCAIEIKIVSLSQVLIRWLEGNKMTAWLINPVIF